MHERRAVACIAAATSIVAFLAYAALAAHDPMFGDGTELVASAITNGIAHPPGYPLWIVLGHLATLVPIGTVAYRVNLTAALYHALTAGLVYCSGYVLVRRHVPALFAALLLAVASRLFASWSLQAEVFSLNDLIAAAVVLLCLIWLQYPARWWLFVPLALLFGAGLSNQQTLALLAPLPLWTAWCARRSIPNARACAQILAAACVAFAAAFLLPYAHTIVASQHLTRWQLGQARTLPDLVPLILRRDFGTFVLVPVAAERGGSPLDRVVAVITYGGWAYLAIAFGMTGLWLTSRRNVVVFAALAAATTIALFPLIANIDIATGIARAVFLRFALLPLVTLAPFAACAVLTLERLVRNTRLRLAVFAAAWLGGMILAAVTLQAVSLAQAHDSRSLARDILTGLPPHAILFTAGAAAESAIIYYQTIEHERPDVIDVSYVCLFYPQCRDELASSLRVPPVFATISPNEMRDELWQANPGRAFFVAGDRPAHVAGPLSQPLVDGVVSRMIPLAQRVDTRAQYQHEVALQSRSGYADVSASFWQSNGFDEDVRALYAAGFYFTALDAKQLGDPLTARHWLERAHAYVTDPLIDAALRGTRDRERSHERSSIRELGTSLHRSIACCGEEEPGSEATRPNVQFTSARYCAFDRRRGLRNPFRPRRGTHSTRFTGCVDTSGFRSGNRRAGGTCAFSGRRLYRYIRGRRKCARHGAGRCIRKITRGCIERSHAPISRAWVNGCA